MKDYFIKYTESYSDIYKVRANTLLEAISRLDEEIRDGTRQGPELCDESSYEEVHHEE